MAFNITGSATVSDVRDGVSPPTIYLTNENETFTASATGAVTDFSGFSTEVQAFVGTSEYTYAAGSSAAGTQFNIGSATVLPAGADLTVTVSALGVITIADAGSSGVTGFADDDTINNASITIPVTIAGFSATFNRVITISKSIGGSAPIIRVEANTQTVEYNSAGAVAATENIVVTANELNFTEAGTVTFTQRSGGSGAFSALAGAGITIGGSGTSETVTITPAAYNTLLGSNRTVTIRATRGTVYDQITIARVNDGAAAVSIILATSSGSDVLRSDSDVVVKRADIYIAGVLQTPGSDWTYAWSKDGTALTSGNQAAMTGAAQQAGEGFNQRSLRIEGDGITDNTSSLFACNVIDPS